MWTRLSYKKWNSFSVLLLSYVATASNEHFLSAHQMSVCLSPAWDVVLLKTLTINIDNRYNIVWRWVWLTPTAHCRTAAGSRRTVTQRFQTSRPCLWYIMFIVQAEWTTDWLAGKPTLDSRVVQRYSCDQSDHTNPRTCPPERSFPSGIMRRMRGAITYPPTRLGVMLN